MQDHIKSESKQWQVAVRVSSDIHRAICAAAEAERRTPTALIRNTLEDVFKNRNGSGLGHAA